MLLRSGKYVEQGKVHRLLIIMAKKRAIEWLRNHNSHEEFLTLPVEDDEQPAELEPEEPPHPTRSEMLLLRRHIRVMKERQRAIFFKRYHGIPYEKISQSLGITTQLAKVEFSRTIKKLRLLLKKKQ